MGLKPLSRLWIVKNGLGVIHVHTLFKTPVTHMS